MANEASVQSGFSIVKKSGSITQINHRTLPASFRVTVTGTKGPTPGAIEVTTSGAEVDLSELTTPGLCRLMNMDDTNFVTYGILDVDGNTFHGFGELGPGESYVFKLSRDIGLGLGTAYESLFLVADTATCDVLVEAFEK